MVHSSKGSINNVGYQHAYEGAYEDSLEVDSLEYLLNDSNYIFPNYD